MNQKFDHPNASEPVSTVTKHIKIYSDNPIHDCIDRIITAVSCIDEDNGWRQSASVELYDAADKLLAHAWALRVEETNKLLTIKYAKRPN